MTQSHKSPSGQRWVRRRDKREILATRYARIRERKAGLSVAHRYARLEESRRS